MLKHIDISAAMRRLAERKIEEAIQEGKFDHLEGAGMPLDLEPMPADENARLLWWAIRILKQNDVVPDEVKYRKAIAILREKCSAAGSETELRVLVGQANELIRRLNTMGTNLIESMESPIDLDDAINTFRARGTRP